MRALRADDFISVLINQFNEDLSKHFGGSDVIAIQSPIKFGLDNIIRHEIESLHAKEDSRPPRLVVVLETAGGYVETVERIYHVFRKYYKTVEFIVPNYAYSAGTVLVLSGDAIYMDYYSVLGPIDPQYELDNGRMVPGLGYLQKFIELCGYIDSCNGPPSEYRAELAYLLRKFDPAILFHLEQARDHSISLLEEWLPKHKFKNWRKTATRGRRVTPSMRKRRAKRIAEILSNPKRWHSHGRGIGLRDLESDEIDLRIIDFGKDEQLNKRVRSYYELLLDYCGKLGCRTMDSTVIHSANGLRRF